MFLTRKLTRLSSPLYALYQTCNSLRQIRDEAHARRLLQTLRRAMLPVKTLAGNDYCRKRRRAGDFLAGDLFRAAVKHRQRTKRELNTHSGDLIIRKLERMAHLVTQSACKLLRRENCRTTVQSSQAFL